MTPIDPAKTAGMQRKTNRRYYICIKNDGYAASLQVRTVYPGVSDPEAESHGMLRIVDESGEDLFPERFFVPIEVPEAAIAALSGLTTRFTGHATCAVGSLRSATSSGRAAELRVR